LSTQASTKIGNTRLSLSVAGCIVCGTEYSWEWRTAKTITVKIGRKDFEIPIFICGDCFLKKGGQQVLL